MVTFEDLKSKSNKKVEENSLLMKPAATFPCGPLLKFDSGSTFKLAALKIVSCIEYAFSLKFPPFFPLHVTLFVERERENFKVEHFTNYDRAQKKLKIYLS